MGGIQGQKNDSGGYYPTTITPDGVLVRSWSLVVGRWHNTPSPARKGHKQREDLRPEHADRAGDEQAIKNEHTNLKMKKST